MEQKLNNLFLECIEELKRIGIDILDEKKYGKINISISKRSNKRYGCCKQEEPDKRFKTIKIIKRRKIVRYEKFNKHNIEISKWVLDLEDSIIKNTIIHELIHCIPYCNNHGVEFKKYADLINFTYGYNISRVGNKRKDFEISNINYDENEIFKYKILCRNCKNEFYRQRLSNNFTKKYRCAKCNGTLLVIKEGGKFRNFKKNIE